MNRRILSLLALALGLSPAVAHAGSGGPDAFGYTWEDSYEFSGPAYFPETFSNTLSMGDDSALAVTLPFSFDFYGTSYSTIYVESNGLISFGSPNGSTGNSCGGLPSTPVAAPWFLDLDPPNNGSVGWDVHYSAPNRVFVAKWENIEAYPNSTGFATFEVQLFESSNDIEFHYTDVTFSNSAQDYGLQGWTGIGDGFDDLVVQCDAGTLDSFYAVRFSPPLACPDNDLDGYSDSSCGGLDCDDTDSFIFPGAIELCDGADNDCNGSLPGNEQDSDSDGWMTCEGDCDDVNGNVSPGQAENTLTRCTDGDDNDCDGAFDFNDSDCAPFVGDDDDDDDDDDGADDDDATADDDDATSDDDDATSDDDDATSDDDDATADDDDSATTGDDDDDDDDDGGGGGGRSSRGACSVSGGAPLSGLALALSLLALAPLRRRR